MQHYDVVIVGAGPTGLMAANQLARYKINFLVIDGKSGPTEQSRAIVITARSMEIYQQMGISQVAIDNGRFITNLFTFINGRKKASAHIGEFGKGKTDFSYMLAFEQSKNEVLLFNHLQKNGHSVSWNTKLIHISQQPGIVNLTIAKTPGGHTEEITATYVIGCDGAKSLVRHSLDFTFKGGTYEKRFYVADTRMKWNNGDNELVLFPGRHIFCGFFPMAGSNTHRLIGTLPKHLDGKNELTFDDVEGAVKEAVKIPITFEEKNWFSIYRLHHRSVEKFNQGNCFLAGDAAHIHSPAGGQGMNTGLQDAYNLCWKLALVLKGIADPKLLDTYNEERLPFAKWLLKFTDRVFAAMTSSNPIVSWIRTNIFPLFVNLFLKKKWVTSAMFNAVAQLRWSYDKNSISNNLSKQALTFTSGDRLPYILLRNVSESKSIYTLLVEPMFHLLLIGNTHAHIKERDFIKPIHLDIADWKKLGVSKPIYILVRPDNYIGLISDALDNEQLDNYLQEHCHIKS